jgi:hypothetical protein
VVHPPVLVRLSQYWGSCQFSVADLARWSGMSESSVRKAVTRGEEEGVLKRVASEGQKILYSAR